MWKFLFASVLLVSVAVCAHDSRHVTVLDGHNSGQQSGQTSGVIASFTSSEATPVVDKTVDTKNPVAPSAADVKAARCQAAVQSAQMMRRGINDISVRANCN
jgi:hypothetical protein